MADFYCDHGAYASALGTTPTWGVPQEGDGTSKDAATSSAVASIAFASIPTSGTISVCGAVVSTTGVIGAASADAAANTLAANINATTNTVSTTFANATTTNANQLRNVAYARGPSSGAPSGTCQIMMRGGSASHNTTGIASTFDGSPTINQFSGGAGGCWGYALNNAALGVSSSIAAFNYGALLFIPLFGATPTLNDDLWMRTGGGASKTITLTLASATTIVAGALSKRVVFDTNTKWTGDSQTGALKIVFNATAWAHNHKLTINKGGRASEYIALAQGGFEIEYVCSAGSGSMAVNSADSGSASIAFKNVVFRDSSTNGGSGLKMSEHGVSTGGQVSAIYEDCKYVVTTPRTTVLAAILEYGFYQSQAADIRFYGCEFDFNISGVSDPGQLLRSNTESTNFKALFRNCRFTGFAGGYTLMSALGGIQQVSTAQAVIVVDNCSGLKMPATYIGAPTSTALPVQDAHSITFSNAALATQAGMRVEDCRGVAEWLPDDPNPFPYLASTLPGSGTPYSMRLLWIRAVPLSRARPYESPLFRMFTQLAAAQRSLTLRLFVPSSVSTNVKAAFCYIDSTGVARREETEVVSSGASAWTNSANYAGYVPKEFQLTTAYPVKANSEVSASILFVGSPPGADATVAIYVDPEFVVA